MIYVDWNCDVLKIHETIAQPIQNAVPDTLLYLRRNGIYRVCLTPTYFHTEMSVALFFVWRDMAYKTVESLFPEDVKVRLETSVMLAPNLHQCSALKKLLLSKRHYLMLRMPQHYEDWMDYELNRLLYHTKFNKLLFSSFENCIAHYSEEQTQRLMRIRNAAFQFSYSALSDPAVCEIIHQLLSKKQIILLGSGIDSVAKSKQFSLSEALSAAQKHLTEAEIERILLQTKYFWTK